MVCKSRPSQSSYAYMVLMRANELKTAVSSMPTLLCRHLFHDVGTCMTSYTQYILVRIIVGRPIHSFQQVKGCNKFRLVYH